MKFGVGWRVKGIRPEARKTAEEAARRSGVSLGEWLNAVILQQAEQARMPSPPLTNSPPQRVEQPASRGPEAYAPKGSRYEPDQFAGAPPPELPSVRMPPSLERAIAEIAARQRVLNSNAGPAPQRQPQAAMPAAAPRPAQDLSVLEDHLRNITNLIETLRKPGVEEAINALRDELGEIGRTLSDAMPRRALEAIERQIQGLDQRIAEGRQAGVDAAALGGIEHGLAEVRDALHGLMPAENLTGFTDAVENLAHKIDLIVAHKDPATLAQLESSIITLREMSNHVASNETVRGLAAQVHALGEKIETMAGVESSGDAFQHLEHRMAVLSDALAERSQSGGAVPPRLEALIESLHDKIERMQHAQGGSEAFNHLDQRIAALAEMLTQRGHGGGDAFGHLEDRIVKLVEKLDASDSRLGHLEGIERGLADLLVHIENMWANKDAGGLREQGSPQVDGLKHDIARTQDALEAVHGTLGHVVDRLAMIENNIRGEAHPRGAYNDDVAPDQAIRTVGDAPPLAASMPATVPPPAAPRRMPAADQLPIEADLPADQPLEPGSGPPLSQANPAARIAASEAALGAAQPAAAASAKSNFIAAARRAAQAAGQQPNARVPRTAANTAQGASSLGAKMIKRVKSLFIAASIIAIVVGSAQIVSTVLDLGNSKTKTAEAPPSDSETAETTVPSAAPETTASTAATSLELPKLPALGPLASPPVGSAVATTPPQQPAQATPSLFDPPMLGSRGDITGSISRPAGTTQAPRTAPAVPQPSQQPADRLPIAIGGPKLRSAAIAGDGAAAYEVAVRFAEGRGVPANVEEAAYWYERAASKGVAPAQFRYASILEKGLGVKKDLAQARRLYLAAADKGNSKAMHNLAVLYAEGIDGKPDYATAVQWFRKAALRGVADSQFNLGVLCARGLGIEKSYAEAYKWFALAAAQGDKEAGKKRDEVAADLDASALTAAQHAVKSFVAEPQPQDATVVREPAGGWDAAAGAPPRAKARPTGPLALGAIEAGKQ
jgi:localization factor PodJL